ncbi:MAG: uracil-DNA glycosylase family protein, partial [Pseudomonadota bacterium]
LPVRQSSPVEAGARAQLAVAATRARSANSSENRSARGTVTPVPGSTVRCALYTDASAPSERRWLVVTESGPGRNDDDPVKAEQAQRLLDAMLRAVGAHRKERGRAGADIASAIAQNRPHVVLAAGRAAGQRLLESREPLNVLRGRLHRLDDAAPVIVTYHPAYLLRAPAHKRGAWDDLLRAAAAAGESP